MNSRNLDLAAQFCELVNKPHLLEYLGLPEDASPDAAQKKLKARRKYMQGMQSNPKYKQEAMFLIKNFSSLTAVLKQPVDYLDDARRRTESQHIPVLKMTIQGVLAGGSLNHDQEDFLRRNALELGVSESTFEELLEELCKEAGVGRANADVRVSPRELETLDFYGILGVPRHASRDEIYARYRTRKEECQALTDPGQRESERMRVEKAWKVLGDAEARGKYDMSWTRTGPPARNRQTQSQAEATTAPPIKQRPDLSEPPSLAPAKLEILSARQQRIELKGAKVKVVVEVRNGGEQPLQGKVIATAPWLRVLTPELDPLAKQQPIRVEIDPAQVKDNAETAALRIALEDGSFSTIDFEVFKPNRMIPMVAAGVAVVALLVVLAGLALFLGRETTATITIDPWAAEVLIDGKAVGRGGRIVLDNPPGTATVTVRHPNFKPWVKDVELSPGAVVHAELQLSSEMLFKPEDSMRRANLGQDVAGQTMAEFRPKLDRCLKLARTSANEELKGTLRIHVAKSGTTNGFEIKGDGATSSKALDCIKRQAAGPLFPALKSGDFATVRYDYIISGP